MSEHHKERESSLPPTYQCYQEGKRIFISYQKDGLRYSLPHYWYSREKAERAAWEHYHKESGIQSPRSRWNDDLSLLTSEKRAKLITQAQIDYLQSFQWERLSTDTLNEIAEWMHEHGFDTIALQRKT